MPIKYYLQPNANTPDPNDQFARVETLGNLTPDELAQELVNRGVVTSKAQGLAVITGYESLIAEKVADGFAVNTPLMTVRAGIEGVFPNPTSVFDSALHAIRANFRGGPMLNAKLLTATVEKITKSLPEPVLVAFINKSTGGVNATVTPGGIGQIKGGQLKFDPAIAADGIYWVPTGAGAAVKVPNPVATHTEGELMFTIPALAVGTWRLQVRRTYGTANPVLRTGELGVVLSVA